MSTHKEAQKTERREWGADEPEKNREEQSTAWKTLAVVGVGYVGLPLAEQAYRRGYSVTGIDIDEEKVSALAHRLERKNGANPSLTFSTDFLAVADADIIAVCVPTPVYKNHAPNLSPLKAACRDVGRYLRAGQLVILESTVNPNVTESIVVPLLEKNSGLAVERDFFVAHAPERINPGDSLWHVGNIPRVVGGIGPESLERASAFYRSVIDAAILEMNSVREAEAVKVVENSFRDVNIAFANELALSFARLGINVENVIRGASTKPFSFLAHYPGCGVGGHCIPVDPYYLIRYAEENGFHHDFLSLARKINNRMPAYTADLLLRALKDLSIPFASASAAVLGVAYKPNIEDDRESPSYKIIERLERAGLSVRVFDPFVPKQSTAETIDEAVSGATAVVVATAHQQFVDLSPDFFTTHGVRAVVDGRNCLDKEKFLTAGIVYRGIGI
ncbi:MAG: nucleotide sugar dehydrogenase [bacterium]|nr:nucleotide sugar dehydrogenase [bacterium]MDZ4285117.1 nucleotide sugar dehydrogenase [Patescibacteria group bacterium]